MPEQANDVEDGMCKYSGYGNCVFHPSLKWVNTPRDNIIDFSKENDIAELTKGLKIGSMVDSIIQD